MNNFDTFINKYTTALYDAVRDHREEYAFGLDNTAEVVAKMRIGFRNGSYNKDSRAIKAVCKQLKIKHTYKAINEYLLGEVRP